MATPSSILRRRGTTSNLDLEHGQPRPNSVTRQAAVLLNSGIVVKAKLSYPSQNQMDIHTLQDMMARWRERSSFIEQALASQSLSQDDIFIYQSEWTNLVRRLNAAQNLLDLLLPMEV